MYTIWDTEKKRYVTLHDFDRILPLSVAFYNAVGDAELDMEKYKLDKTNLKIYKVRLL